MRTLPRIDMVDEPPPAKKTYDCTTEFKVRFCLWCNRPFETTFINYHHKVRTRKDIHHENLPSLGLKREICLSCAEKDLTRNKKTPN